ncbi:MAG TPA: CGNR zinc finger domain-containing protein [Solirubrobacterales bacterium]|nr:CGNR zinc finger domain-containing protein [Solirubrobacterales bacterium]
MSREIEKTVQEEADLLVAFVNTCDLEAESEELADPAQLQAWIEAASGEFLPDVDAEDLERVRALRESLRALLRANNGGAADDEELAPLREAAERSRYRPTISAGGLLGLVPARADLTGFEARLVLAVERVQSHGAWARLKACAADECRWAFFDTTRNRSRTWCSMEECGNREKTRRYRQRKGSPGAASG